MLIGTFNQYCSFPETKSHIKFKKTASVVTGQNGICVFKGEHDVWIINFSTLNIIIIRACRLHGVNILYFNHVDG